MPRATALVVRPYLLHFLFITACAAAPARRVELRVPLSVMSSGPDLPVALTEPVIPVARAELTRSGLNAVLSAGPGSFLGRISVVPALVHGRFTGFRLTRSADLARWNHAGADIHIGDVIQRVNGISVERPEGVMAIFGALRDAHSLRIDLLRDGRSVVITQPITDGVREFATPP